MIAAIMQPYFFPYIGYFQLMKAVDVFVLYDDAQYMKGGWINRNRIRGESSPKWLTFPVARDDHKLPINRRNYIFCKSTTDRINCSLHASYAKAPAYHEVASLIGEAFAGATTPNVAKFNAGALTLLAKCLGIDCSFVYSSALDSQPALTGEAKVIDLCQCVRATHYVNAIGGASLYNAGNFEARDIDLTFLRTKSLPARFSNLPQHLSIIDMLMHEGIAGTAAHLSEYELLTPDAARLA